MGFDVLLGTFEINNVALFQEYFNGEATSSEEVVFWMFLHHNSKEGVYYKKVFISPNEVFLATYVDIM